MRRTRVLANLLRRCTLASLFDCQRRITAAACLSLLMTAGQVRPGGFHLKIQTRATRPARGMRLPKSLSRLFVYEKHPRVRCSERRQMCWLSKSAPRQIEWLRLRRAAASITERGGKRERENREKGKGKDKRPSFLPFTSFPFFPPLCLRSVKAYEHAAYVGAWEFAGGLDG